MVAQGFRRQARATLSSSQHQSLIWSQGRSSYPAYSWITLREGWGEALAFPELELHAFRHGVTTFNEQSRVSGRVDVPLAETGLLQARELGAALCAKYSTYDLAFCSDLRRSRETLGAVLAAFPRVPPLLSDSRLSERALGNLEGGPSIFIKAYAEGDLDYAPEGGGESYREVARRIMSFLLDLSRGAEALPPRARLLVSTHVGPLRVLHAICTGTRSSKEMMNTDFGNCQVSPLRLTKLPWPRFLS